MNVRTSPHPTDQTLSSYGLGKLDDMLAEAVSKHLEECEDCQNRVAEMSADSFLLRVREAQDDSRTSAKGESRVGGIGNARSEAASAPPLVDTLPPGLAEHADYQIKKELGRGGMGVVYLAHNSMMGRDEVLKVMGRQIMERPGLLERFNREIRAVAKLRHPNIVTAYTAFRLNESIVFAMEFVDGLDLSKMVKAKGPLPVAHACNFIYQAALGLQHAHEEGLVHRDIKPGNLMLARSGQKATIKVLDFGLAKVTREQKVDGGLTSVGQALGTPDFIAPEQIINAQSADIRADIYSLGGTLYYLLTGRPPFKANSLYDIYQAHISRDADPLNLVRPEVSFELAALVGKMMAKDPSRRFQTPGEVAEGLKPFFRKGAGGFQGVRADVSVGRQFDRTVIERVPATTEPDADAGAARGGIEKAIDRTGDGGRWESLIRLSEEGSSVDIPMVSSPTRMPPRKGWLVALAASSLALIAMGVIVITITIKDGEIRVEQPDDKEANVDVGGVTIGVKPRVDAAQSHFPGGGISKRLDVEGSADNSERGPVGDSARLSVPGRMGESIKARGSAPLSDLDQIATGKWIRMLDSTTVLPEPEKMRFENGILELNRARLAFPETNARNVIVRAKILLVSGQNVGLGVRCSAADGYGSWFNGPAFGGGDLCGIGKNGNPWRDFASAHIGRTFKPNEYFEMALAAIEDTLLLYVDGVQIVNVKNDELARGFIRIGSVKGNGRYKDVEYQILDFDRPGITSTFVPLFNGIDLNGWAESANDHGTWKVVDGVLEGRGSGGPDGRPILTTQRQDFTNFRLRVKFRYREQGHGQVEIRHSPVGEGRNGYLIRQSTWPSTVLEACPVGSIHKANSFMYGNRRFTYDQLAVAYPVPTNAWNQMEIVAVGARITTSVNGKQVATYLDTSGWHGSGGISLVAWPDVALVEYQEITIQELPE